MSDKSYLWVVNNPMNTAVALRDEKLGIHAVADHPSDSSRLVSYPFVKGVILQPRFIYYDNDYELNKRVRYSDQVFLPGYDHLQTLVVAVDTDREPHEIVTWMVKTSTKKESGGVIYDSRAYNGSPS